MQSTQGGHRGEVASNAVRAGGVGGGCWGGVGVDWVALGVVTLGWRLRGWGGVGVVTLGWRLRGWGG